MMAILKKELSSYFKSFSGYIFLVIFYFFAGLFFVEANLLVSSGSLRTIFYSIYLIAIFLMPVLTMRLMSEEFKLKTDQALFTAPIKPISIVLGKYFSALCMYLIGISIILVYAIVISFFCTPSWLEITGSFIGLFLLGASSLSIGMYVSSLTESQVIAAIGSYAVTFVILFIEAIANFFDGTFLKDAIRYLSFLDHYQNFSRGVLNVADIVFFISICTVFVFLTVQALEKRKYN